MEYFYGISYTNKFFICILHAHTITIIIYDVSIIIISRYLLIQIYSCSLFLFFSWCLVLFLQIESNVRDIVVFQFNCMIIILLFFNAFIYRNYKLFLGTDRWLQKTHNFFYKNLWSQSYSKCDTLWHLNSIAWLLCCFFRSVYL